MSNRPDPRVTQIIPATGWWLLHHEADPDQNYSLPVACFALVEHFDEAEPYQTVRPLLGMDCTQDGTLYEAVTSRIGSDAGTRLVYDPERRENADPNPASPEVA